MLFFSCRKALAVNHRQFASLILLKMTGKGLPSVQVRQGERPPKDLHCVKLRDEDNWFDLWKEFAHNLVTAEHVVRQEGRWRHFNGFTDLLHFAGSRYRLAEKLAELMIWCNQVIHDMFNGAYLDPEEGLVPSPIPFCEHEPLLRYFAAKFPIQSGPDQPI